MADNGKVYVVTGGLGAIGLPVCKELAKSGATVVMVVRDAAKAKPTIDALSAETGNKNLTAIGCDLGSLASIRKAAAEIAQKCPKIDALFNSAAFYCKDRKTTSDNFEMQFGVNHLAPFLLTNLLRPQLEASGNARVVGMSFASKEPINFDDLNAEKKYDALKAYFMSKAANLYFTLEAAERWKGKVAVHAVDPGRVKTTLIAEAPLPVRIFFALSSDSPEVGAKTPLAALTSPDYESKTGLLIGKKGPAPFPPGPDNAEQRKKLWDLSAKMVGLS